MRVMRRRLLITLLGARPSRKGKHQTIPEFQKKKRVTVSINERMIFKDGLFMLRADQVERLEALKNHNIDLFDLLEEFD